MNCYVLVYPRPIGVEPTIYLTKPQIEDSEDPFLPFVQEFNNEIEAARYIKDYFGYLYRDALKEYNNGKIKIVP